MGDRSKSHGPGYVNDDNLMRLGMALMELDRCVSSHWSGQVELTGVKLRLGDAASLETLVILTGLGGDGTPIVAFHGGVPPSEALAGAMRRLLSGNLKWKEDEYEIKRRARAAQG